MRLLVALGVLVLSRSFTIGLPVEGRVVDAKTGQPVEGVVVVAGWTLVSGHIAGENTVGQVQLAETTTGRSGAYRFPAWIRLHWPLFPFSTLLHDSAEFPGIYLFKPGYWPGYASNFSLDEPQSATGLWMVRRSTWDGRDIELEPLVINSQAHATDQAYMERLRYFQDSIKRLVWRQSSGMTCRWDRVRKMLLALRAAGKGSGRREFQLDDVRPLIEACGKAALYEWK